MLSDYAIDIEMANVMDYERRALYHNRSAIEMSFNMVARIDNATGSGRHARSAGKKAAAVLDMIGPYVQPGVTTDYLNQLCHDYIVDELQCIPAPSITAAVGVVCRSRSLFAHRSTTWSAMAFRRRAKTAP